MARSGGAMNLDAARFEQPRELRRGIFGGLLNRNRQMPRLRTHGQRATEANQTGTGLSHDGWLLLAAARAGPDGILDGIEIACGLDGERCGIAFMFAGPKIKGKSFVMEGVSRNGGSEGQQNVVTRPAAGKSLQLKGAV